MAENITKDDTVPEDLAERPSKRSCHETSNTCCFGMLIDLAYQRDQGFIESDLPVDLEIEAGTLIDKASRRVFGHLQARTNQILIALQNDLNIQIFADRLVDADPRPDVGNRRKRFRTKTTNASTLELCANLYGPSGLFERVGLFVSRCHLFLQHPRHCDRNVLYRNPHCLSSDSADVLTSELDKLSSLSNDDGTNAIFNPIDAFSDSIEHTDLLEAPQPLAIRTSLYKHQKQALDFMLRREHGWALKGSYRDVWKLETNDHGKRCFLNTVTGERRSKRPEEFRGGLLTDAPGLGKTLCILALIARSKETANNISSDSSPTLLIVPKSLMSTWEEELERHSNPSFKLRHCKYYGKDRLDILKSLENYDLVITTYAVARIDWKTSLDPDKASDSLYKVKWGRIVLDEAHIIREPSKSYAKSVCALQTYKRWAVTGTPIQNRLTDLFSLMKFLRCYPFDNLDVFKTHVVESWRTRYDPNSIAKLKTLVNCLSLRRPKTIVSLPPRKDTTRLLQLSPLEWRYYEQVRGTTRGKLKSIDPTQVSDAKTFMNALQWVNKLRLICNHGIMQEQIDGKDFEPTGLWTEKEAQMRFDQLDHVGLAKCSKLDCSEDLSSTMSTDADNANVDEPRISESMELLCVSCFEAHAERSTRYFKVCNHLPRCPSKSNSTTSHTSNSSAIGSDNSVPTKIRHIVEDILNDAPEVKSVIFSSWNKTFDIIQSALRARSIRFLRFDGTLSHTRRANVIRAFRSDKDIKVLLATITCGGVGLDLTVASKAHIVEPQWNPMSESQALDRIHRLGQESEVTMTRYIMQNTWEEQVLALQRRKQNLADLTLGTETLEKTELTTARLMYLKELVG